LNNKEDFAMSHLRFGNVLKTVLFIVVFLGWADTEALLAGQAENNTVWEFVKEIPKSFLNPSFVDQTFSHDALLLVANSKGEEKRRYQGIKEIKGFLDACIRKLTDFQIETKEVDIVGDKAHAKCSLSFKHSIAGSKTGILFAKLITENSRWVIKELLLKV
jgi:hypothetical protein